MSPINSELLKGSAATIVLSLLLRKEMYGYELMREIESRSKGHLELQEGSLYPILHSLEKSGAIAARWEETEKARKRKFYRITRDGRRLLSERKKEWSAFRNLIEQFITRDLASD